MERGGEGGCQLSLLIVFNWEYNCLVWRCSTFVDWTRNDREEGGVGVRQVLPLHKNGGDVQFVA